jgi:uncharacterized protein
VDRPVPTARSGGGWRGALGRILAFIALTTVISLPLGVLWTLLAGSAEGAATYGGATAVAVAALVAGAVLLRVLDGRPPAALGIGLSRQTPVHIVLGWAIGVAALAVAAAAMFITGSLRYTTESGTAAGWLLTLAAHGGIFAVAALMEEALFRGYPFQVLARATGPMTAAVVSSVLFALLHVGNPEVGVFSLVNIFLAGLLLAAAYLRTLSLWFATALHVGWNWATASLFDLPVSGITDFETPLYEPVVGGPAWWTGGAFGPEGGMTGTIGFGLALFLVLRLRWLRPDPRIAGAGALVLDSEREIQ